MESGLPTAGERITVPSQTVEGRRIKLSFGSLTRKYTLTAPPWPNVGDCVEIEGEGAKWRVTAVRIVEILAMIPAGGGR